MNCGAKVAGALRQPSGAHPDDPGIGDIGGSNALGQDRLDALDLANNHHAAVGGDQAGGREHWLRRRLNKRRRMGGGQAGPIVLLNCTFHGNGRAESHQRWSTGMLYDNCRAADGGIDFRNRGSMGSGHGWSMGWGVAWNCDAKDFIVQQPPGVMNWMIGCTGRSRPEPRPFGSGPDLPEGIMDSHGTPVTPQSLYLAQPAERLGPQALANIGY